MSFPKVRAIGNARGGGDMLVFLNGVFGVLMVAAALSDIRRYRIPNWISVAVIVLFAVRLAVTPQEPWGNLVVGLVVLAAGFGLFAANLFGAGDAKLLAVASLWVGPSLVPDLVLATALAGGAIAGAILVCRRITGSAAATEPSGIAMSEQPGGKLITTPMPYGVAIAAGGLWCLVRLYFGS